MSQAANTQRNRQLVIDAICHVYEISQEKLSSRRRLREITSARQMYYKVAREYLGMTLNAIAGSLWADNYKHDHTTVMHSVRLVNDLISIGDPEVVYQYDQVMSYIRQRANVVSTIQVKVGIEQMSKVIAYLQREEIPFTVIDSVISHETKSTEYAL